MDFFHILRFLLKTNFDFQSFAMAQIIQWRPPIQIAAGDSLVFQQNFPNYLPPVWAIRLTVSLPNSAGGATKIVQVVSSPDSTNQFHTFDVNDFLGTAAVGNYILSEEIFNATTGEEHQIYYADNFFVGPSLDTGSDGTAVLGTFSEQALPQIEAQILLLTNQIVNETDVERSRFLFTTRKELMEQRAQLREERQNEIALAKQKNGQPTGNDLIPKLRCW
jgi:hypothetical protein